MKRAGAQQEHDHAGGSKSLKTEPGVNGQDGVAAGPGGAGKSKERKLPTLVYKEAEPLPGLAEHYKRSLTSGEDCLVEVAIAPEDMSKENKRVKARQIWGDGVYTPDSDLVAVLMHLGYYASHLIQPPPAVAEFRAVLRLLPPVEAYSSKARYVKSRAWCSSGEGCSYRVESCWMVTHSGGRLELSPCVDEVPAPHPTFQPVVSDRQIATRSASGASKRQASAEVSVQYSLCNEPWLKYTLAAISDKGLKPSGWMCVKLGEEVLLLEGKTERYQVARLPTSAAAGGEPAATAGSSGGGSTAAAAGAQAAAVPEMLFSLSRCKSLLPLTLMRNVGLPLPADTVEVLEPGAAWEDFRWGSSSLHLRGKEYPLKRMHMMPIGKAGAEAPAAPSGGAAS